MVRIIIFVCYLVVLSLQTKPTNTEDKKIVVDDFKSMMNQSVIDGFFDGDTTKIPKDTYFML